MLIQHLLQSYSGQTLHCIFIESSSPKFQACIRCRSLLLLPITKMPSLTGLGGFHYYQSTKIASLRD